MPYIIDGHNLIGQLPDISLDNPNDEAELVIKLNGFLGRKNTKCVVVFDRGLPGGKSRMSNGKVEVIFAPQHSNADKVIIERIRKTRNPKMWIVVTSDHEVMNEARRHGMQTITGKAFTEQIKPRARPAKPGVDTDANVKLSSDEVEEWMRIFKKGKRK